MKLPRTSRLHLLIFVVLCVAIAVGYQLTRIRGAVQDARSAKPQTSTTFDFGRVRAGDVIKHTFAIPNPGPSAIEVMKFQSTCGCTVAGLKDKSIHPGMSVDMPVSLDTTGKSGEIEQPVIVELSDGTFMTFTLRGFVTDPDLAAVEFGTVLRGTPAYREVSLPPLPDIQLEIGEVQYDVRKLDVTWSAGDRGAQVRIGIAPGVPYGRVTELVTIHTNDPFMPEQIIRVSAMIPFPVVRDPEEITLGLVEPGKEVTGRVRIFSPYEKPFRIVKIEHREGLPVTWREEHKSEKEIDLIVSFTTDIVQEYYKSVLRVAADSDGESCTFDLEIYGVGPSIGLPESQTSHSHSTGEEMRSHT